MKSSHTPGPWAAVSGGPFIKQLGSDPNGSCGDSVIAITSNNTSHMRFAADVGSLEDKANARLISAAPDLLEACKELLAQQVCPLGQSKADRWSLACDKARDAITKAEGNS